ncbi:MAG: hydroxyacid dehydrogenase, partial [Acidimicrobiia bacterium]|nr:hydroxyacid dehydrogenase [Acidimicrobiia bacterium]
MSGVKAPRIAIAPEESPTWLREAVEAGGGHLTDVGEAEALVWGMPFGASDLAQLVANHPDLRWVQLPYAGIEHFVSVLDHDRLWTCGK